MACKNKGKQGRENKKRCSLRSVYNLIQNATSPYTQLRLGPRLLEETPSIATDKQGYASIRQYSRFLKHILLVMSGLKMHGGISVSTFRKLRQQVYRTWKEFKNMEPISSRLLDFIIEPVGWAFIM